MFLIHPVLPEQGSHYSKTYSNSRSELMMIISDVQISSQKKKTGVIAPKRFVQRLKKQNELFRSYMHQVAVISYLFFVVQTCSLGKTASVNVPPLLGISELNLQSFPFLIYSGHVGVEGKIVSIGCDLWYGKQESFEDCIMIHLSSTELSCYLLDTWQLSSYLGISCDLSNPGGPWLNNVDI